MADVDDTKRYDLFVSFHGAQSLNSLGYAGASPDKTVRALIEQSLLPSMPRVERWRPNIFVDSDELRDSIADIFGAILQLRGGGVGLVLLSKEYLTRRYCLAELRALLDLAKLKNDPERKSEAITLRLICMESDSDTLGSVQELLDCIRQRSEDKGFHSFVTGIEDYFIQSLSIVPDIPHPEEHIAAQIADTVWKYWNEDLSRPSLGRTRHLAFLDMQRFFDHEDRRPLGRALNTVVEQYEEIQDVIQNAMCEGVLSFTKLDPLLNACSVCRNGDDAANAVLRFRERWCSTNWSWSRGMRDTLQNYVGEAETVVRRIADVEDLPKKISSNDSVTDVNEYTVFICATTQDSDIGTPLFHALSDRGIRSFLDNIETTENLYPVSQETCLAFSSAKIVVFILSPHFIAESWTMEVLNYFLTRHKKYSVAERNRTSLIPIFYGVSVEDCMSKEIFEWTHANGERFFEQQAFYHAQHDRSRNHSVTLERLGKLSRFNGVEIVFGKWNKLHNDGVPRLGFIPGEERFLVQRIVSAVQFAWDKISCR